MCHNASMEPISGTPLPPPPPTQTQHPFRTTLRTVFQAAVALAAVAGVLVEALGVDQTAPFVVAFLAVAAGVTRVMANPAVEVWLQKFIPWLAAEPT